MCFQVVELYSACRCPYYSHPVDRCPTFGKAGHRTSVRSILVGYACSQCSTLRWARSRPAKTSSRPATARGTPDPRDSDIRPRIIRTSHAREEEITKKTSPKAPPASDNGGTVQPPPEQSRTPDSEDALDTDESESDLSESESLISTTSSATTVDTDVLEATFNRLLNYDELRFLWPQLVRRAGSRQNSLRDIERFLRRYSEDLEHLASKSVGGAGPRGGGAYASQFVRRSRFNLSQRLFEAHQLACEIDVVAGPEPVKASGGNETHVDCIAKAAAPLVFWAVESFLFETEPIRYLQANIKAFVSLSQPKTIGRTLGDLTTTWLVNMASKVARPPIPEGKERVTWTCKCGRELWDDFIELEEGAVEALQAQLRQRYARDETCTVTDDTGGEHGSRSNAGQNDRISRLRHSIRGWVGASTSSGSGCPPSLPQHNQRAQTDIELGICPEASAPASQDVKHNFVMLCVPFLRWAAKLHQAEICRINSDQELFQVMRHCYSMKRGSSAWTRLRKVQGIDFVMFELFSSQLVDVQERPSIPSGSNLSQYTFEPLSAGMMPPIGSNLLMHLFEHPEDAEVVPVLFRKIPKKLHARLEACPRKGSSVGWGLQFVEGMNWLAVLVYGCAGFAVALVAAISWAVTKEDVQGAFAIAAFIVAFLLFCGGIARAEIHA